MSGVVVFYSHTGVTDAVARRIAEAASAQVTPIVADPPIGSSLLSIGRAIWLTLWRGSWPIAPDAGPLPRDGPLIVGGPIWAGRLHPVVRTWVAGHTSIADRPYAVFSTSGGPIGAGMRAEVEQFFGRPPVAALNITSADLKKGRDAEKIEAFVATLVTAT